MGQCIAQSTCTAGREKIRMSLIDRLPKIRGKYREQASLAPTNWFGVGGPAEVLFKPADTQDLANFMRGCPYDVPITVLGVGSNVIVRDGGLDGVVIKLGRGFTGLTCEGQQITAGAACIDLHVAEFSAAHSLSGLEFLSGIPGTIGGALKMNAGAYGREVQDVLVNATYVTRHGDIETHAPESLRYQYRHSETPEGAVFVSGCFAGNIGEPEAIHARIVEIQNARAETQPIRSRTGGSTFKNPTGHKAWELIDAAGCRGMMLGEAQVSEKHCNFLLNTGNAKAADLEALGEKVRTTVKAHSGIELEWEIKRIGKPA